MKISKMALEWPTKEGDSPVSKNFQSLVLGVAHYCSPLHETCNTNHATQNKIFVSCFVIHDTCK